ncbi:MAG TPA: aminotransferase class I/II-fold pyridoxal phosphate-dependent enzyme [Terriglobales bacterium]|nr:aminotransferase class I/II-fold pyridoxal phosphate-dependent enzyme [Terriglobales bacterium]
MPLSRREFLAAGAGAAAAGVLQFPFPQMLAGQGASRADRPIRLNSNENAYGPLPSVLEAMRGAARVASIYPFQRDDEYMEKVARFHGVERERVIAGCGSTEILRMAACAFAGAGRRIIVPTPTFEAILEYARAEEGQVETVPLTTNYAHDLEEMLERVHAKEKPPAGLVYICNPNNPTASLTPRGAIEDFLRRLPRETHVLIDEAYHHFAVGAAGYTSFLERPVDDARVIVARTFSKIYGMAGLRLGYGVGAPEAIQKMRRYRLWDSANGIALECAMAALDDREGLAAAARRIAQDHTDFETEAKRRNVSFIPSFTNFFMVECGRPVRAVMAHFAKQGILIGRPFAGLETMARISLGTPEEMKAFWRAWDTLPEAARA